MKYREASTAINNRNELVAEVAERIERNFILLGATGIEDKLQDVNFAIFHLITSFIFFRNFSKFQKVFRCYIKLVLK